jgi:hypothetical protein
LPSFLCPSLETFPLLNRQIDSSRQAELEQIVAAVITFLETEIRNRTTALIKGDDWRQQQRNNPLGPMESTFDLYGAIRNPRKIQSSIDRCERWLVRARQGVANDRVLQNFVWLCGVSQDVLPEIIADARDCPDDVLRVARLEYAETLYRCVHDHIERVITR